MGQVGDCALLVMALLATTTAAASTPKTLPSNIKRCARTDPNFSECVRDAVEDALPKLKKGLPKLGVRTLDPLNIEKMSVTQSSDGPINVNMVFTNMSSTKVLDDVKVLKVGFDYDKRLLAATTLTPLVKVSCHYSVNGRVLLLPITGTGPCEIDLYDLTCDLKIKGKEVKKDGRDYWDITDVQAKLQPAKMHLKLENLFNGDKQLGETVNRVINDNWVLIYNEVGDSLNQAYSELFKRRTRALFMNVPIDDIFPEKL